MKRLEQLVGQRIAGKYALEELIGKGGFGAVFRATHHPINRAVAVKISLHRTREDLHARFVREAQVQANLRHPACVMLLDFGETDDFFYMVQEFVSGRSLRQELEAAGAMAPGRAVALASRLLEGLAAAHRLGIVHRDIKPANIMLTRGDAGEEDIRILDFGIAKVLSSEDEMNLTGTGMSLGTPPFMAPEQIRNLPVDPRTDLYATGAVLYRLCTGRGPYDGEATIDVLRQHLESPPPSIPGAPPGLNAVFARAMAKAPDDRYGSAVEMAAALRALQPALKGLPPLAGLGEVGALPGPTTTLGEGMVIAGTEAPAGRTGRFVGGAIALCAAGLLAAGGWWWAQPSDVGQAPPAPIATARPAPMTAPPATLVEMDAAVDEGVPIVGEIEFLDPPDAAAVPPSAIPPPQRATAETAGRESKAARAPRATTPRQPSRGAGSVKKAGNTHAGSAAHTAAPKPARVDAKAAFTEALGRCDCPAARRALGALREQDAPRAAALDGRYQDECEMFMPGNCRDKARNGGGQ